LELLDLAAERSELVALEALEGAGPAFAGVGVGAMDTLAQGGFDRVEVLGYSGGVAVAGAAEVDDLSLERGTEHAAGPLLPDGLCGLLHAALLASTTAALRTHEIEAGPSDRTKRFSNFLETPQFPSANWRTSDRWSTL
jgi:hypothetical protein